MKEQREILKEQRLKQRESKDLTLDNNENNLNRDFSSKLDDLDLDKTSEH